MIVLWLTLAIAISLSCNFTPQEFWNLVTDCESATEPTQQDIEYVLAFTGDTFESSDWEKSYTVEPDRVRATWLSNEGGLGFVEYVVISCGYTQAEIENNYSGQSLEEVVFQDYQNLQLIATCANEEGDVILHELTAEFSETTYVMRFWIITDNPTRVLDMLIAFPQISEEQVHSYAEKVFPEMSSCQQHMTE